MFDFKSVRQFARATFMNIKWRVQLIEPAQFQVVLSTQRIPMIYLGRKILFYLIYYRYIFIHLCIELGE